MSRLVGRIKSHLPHPVNKILAFCWADCRGIIAPLHELLEAADSGLGPIAEVHTPEYGDYLRVAHREWSRLPGASAEAAEEGYEAALMAMSDSVLGDLGWVPA